MSEKFQKATVNHTISNQHTVRLMNQKSIVNIIRDAGAVSRIQIANHTNLIPASVSILVNELLQQEYIIQTGEGKSDGGRKPVMLEINPDRMYSIVIDVRSTHITVAVIDFKGYVFVKEKYTIDSTKVIDEIFSGIDKVIADYKINFDKIFAIGIIISGIINKNKEKIVLSSAFNIKDTNVKEIFHKKYNKLVVVERSVNAALYAKSKRDGFERSDNVILVSFVKGIGMSCFLNGQIYNPSAGWSGEIGHTTVDRNGLRCSCGGVGCLITVVSDTAAVRKAQEYVFAGRTTVLRDILDEKGKLCFNDIIQAESNGDLVAKEIFMDMGDYLGVTISNIIKMLNPSRLILAGLFNSVNTLKDSTINILSHRLPQHFSTDVEISTCDYDEDLRIYGMAANLLENEVFKEQ